MKITHKDKTINFKITKDNIKIMDSYKVKDPNDMLEILLNITVHDKYNHLRTRPLDEYIKEWRTHNLLYKIPLKYFKEHCGDCDLSNKESKFRLFVYSILGRY